MRRTKGLAVLARAMSMAALKRLDQERFNRREFFKRTTRGIAHSMSGLAAARLLSACSTRQSSGVLSALQSKDPVVILGGGLSGLVAAYRLNLAGVPCKIFESQNRLGGRIQTYQNFNKEGMFCELGGELIDSGDVETLSLAAELGLETDDSRPIDAGLEPHIFYVGGSRYYLSDLVEGCAPLLARMIPDMKKVFTSLDNPVVTYQQNTEAARYFDQISIEEYLYAMTDVAPWILKSLNMAYLTEYGLETSEQSSLNLMVLLNECTTEQFGVFGSSDECMRIRGGNSQLIETLKSRIESRVPIYYDHKLQKISESGTKIKMVFAQGSSSKEVAASRVICTIPFSILREIEGVQNLDLSPIKKRCINELGYGTNSKTMVGYQDRYWRKSHSDFKATTAYTFTDLAAQTFWDSSRGQPGSHGIITNLLGGRSGLNLDRNVVTSVIQDVETIFPGSKELYDGQSISANWGKNPHAKGSYSCPKAGQYTTFFGVAPEVELNGKLYFAGEHTAIENQGYLNGAVETGNNVVKALLG